MPNTTTNLTLDELVRHYHHAEAWLKRIEQTSPEQLEHAMGKSIDEIIAFIVTDRAKLWQFMIDRIPASHIHEIENLKTELRMASTDSPKIPIEAGQRWQHIHETNLIVEIIGRDLNTYHWHVSQFFNNRYLNACDLTSMALLKYYTKLNP